MAMCSFIFRGSPILLLVYQCMTALNKFALSCSGSIFYGEILNSTLLLTFILFWTISHNYVHLF